MAITSIPTSSVQKTAPLPEHLYDVRGAHIEQGRTRFSVYAPNARSITLALIAFGHEEHRLPMEKNRDGTWSVLTDKASVGRTYRYHVQDCHGTLTYRTDPFSSSTIECHGRFESKVSDVDHYEWNDAKWIARRESSNPMEQPLAIYELYPQCWKKKDGKPLNFRQLAPELVAYCKKMHFSHVELYAILDNTGGWGYQVLNFFAPNHAMGTAGDFQFLVDQLHQNSIGVILDWIPAHYKHNHVEASLHNFDGTDLFSAGNSEWGTMLFDFSKEETKRLLKSNVHYWIDKMHVDMIRIDAVSHIVRRNNGNYEPGIHFLKDLNRSVKEAFPGVAMIAEDPTNSPHLTKSVEQGGLGFDAKWDIGVGIQMRNFLKTPTNERPSHHNDKFMNYLWHIKQNERALFTHSHDEQANRDWRNHYPIAKDKTLYKIDALKTTEEKFADMRNFFAWQILAPSRGYLIHMGDEIGQKRSWDTAVWSHDGAMQWNLLDPSKEQDSTYHAGLQTWISDLNQFYCATPAFWKKGEQGFRLCCDHPVNNVIAYERSTNPEEGVWVIHNFSSGSWGKYDISLGQCPTLSQGNQLEELFNSNCSKYGGNHQRINPVINVNKSEKGNHLSIQIALPPLSTLVFGKK